MMQQPISQWADDEVLDTIAREAVQRLADPSPAVRPHEHRWVTEVEPLMAENTSEWWHMKMEILDEMPMVVHAGKVFCAVPGCEATP